MSVQCQSALLISDLHLTPSMPLTAQRFFDFCQKEARSVEAVFIMGDLFEYWLGDDANASSPFHQEVRNALVSLSAKVKLFYLHGNRDFLLGPQYLKKTGMTLLPDPCLVKIAGQDYVLSHGDALCTADIGYQVFRKWTRKRWVQKLFLKLPLQWRRSIANQLRRNSALKYRRASRYAPANRSIQMDITTSACATLIDKHAIDRLIHGHTHMPGHHHEQLGDTRWQRWVLSDWDLDHPESVLPKASALLIDERGVRYQDLVK